MKKLFALLSLFFCLVAPQKGWASVSYDTENYPFGDYANNEGSITMSGNSFAQITNGYYAATMTGSNLDAMDISRFAFRYTGPGSNQRGWYLRKKDNTTYGLWCTGTNYTPELAICDLRAGDVVTITYTSGSQIKYVNSVSAMTGTAYNTTDANLVADEDIPSGTNVTILSDGNLIIKATDGSTFIQNIEIKAIKDAKYNISTVNNSNGDPETTFSFTGDGRMAESIVAVPFMNVEFGNSANGPIVVDNQVTIPDQNGWTFLWIENQLPYQGTFYVFKPTAKGKLWIKGNLNNSTLQILDYDADGNYQKSLWTASQSGDIEIGWVAVEKNHTYYLVEGKSQLDGGSRAYSTFKLEKFMFQNTFSMGSLSTVLENGSTGGTLTTVKNGGVLNSWEVKDKYDSNKGKKVSDNIDVSDMNVTCTDGVLSLSGIKYKSEDSDKAGTIVLSLNFEGGDATYTVTIPYSASFNNGEGHKWDFYSKVLEIGQYKNNGSELKEQTDNNKWEFKYRVKNKTGEGTHDPMYANVIGMTGDNADMVWETEGLWFDTPSMLSCIYNENDISAQEYTDRYVGILPGGSFRIPALQEGDRVLIYMGSGDGSSTNTCFFHITNAKDAIGNDINTNKDDESTWYKAGGSEWNGIHGDYNLRGAYQFISKGGDMVFEMVGGSMTKLYTIEIYNTAEKRFSVDLVRNNSNDTYQLLNTYKSESGKVSWYQMHYRGKGEGLAQPIIVSKTGTVNPIVGDNSSLRYERATGSGGSLLHYIKYNSVKGEYGTFRMRVPCMDLNGKYVTDYADQNISVGYYEKQDYPYTWDFTDLLRYAKSGLQSDANEEHTNNHINLWTSQNDGSNESYGISLRNNNGDYSSEIMFSGGQLYGDELMFEETKGLSFLPYNWTYRRNGSLRIQDGGLYLSTHLGSVENPQYWNVTIPEVPSGAGVYVRATEVTGSHVYKVGYKNGNGTVSDFVYVGEAENGDNIYAAKGTGEDMTLCFCGVIIKKIAVSVDAKKVNIKGYASESRARVIDNSLTSYFTGKSNVGAYILKKEDIDYTNMTVTLTAVGDQLIPVGTTGAKNGLIIYNADNADDGGEIKILDGGFHLFVPDMHDTEKATLDWGSNELIAQLETTKLSFSGNGDLQNYVLSYSHYQMDENGNKIGDTVQGDEAFYRVGANGINLRDNSAFIQFEKSKLLHSSVSTASAKIMFHTEDDETDVTGIENVSESNHYYNKDAYYTISGVRISKPNKSGIYIKNGKKIIIK